MMHQPYPRLADHTSVGRYFFCAGALLAVVFAWLEPSGAGGLGFPRGLLFWAVQMSLLLPLLVVSQKTVSSIAPTINPWTTTVVVGVVVSILFSPLAYLLDMLFGIPEVPESTSLVAGVVDELGAVAPPVTLLWLGLNAPWILGLNFRSQLNETQVPNESAPVAIKTRHFLDLVAREIGGEIVSISSELHYVRVRTTSGSGMLLYNLKDAIAELGEVNGMQIHRSHWVAQRYIARVIRKDGQRACVMTDGTELPISRRRQEEVVGYVERSAYIEPMV